MSNSTWTIFPAVARSQLIDRLDASGICDQNNAQIGKLLARHLFSQSIHLVSQNAQLFDVVGDFVAETNDLGFLLIKDMPIYALICPYFLDAYCRKGNLYGLSVNRDVNLDDTVALLPNQILLLSVNAETYYRLGLIGEKSTLNKKKNLVEKYRIAIELGQKCFKPEKKNYQRVLECLKRTQLKCDFLIKWKPHEANISPNSLLRYFEHVKANSGSADVLLSKMSLHRCYPSLRTYTNYSTATFSPSIKLEESSLQQIIEWISEQIAEVNCDEPLFVHGIDDGPRCDIYCAELKGFFTSSDVGKLLGKLKAIISHEEIAAIVMHGFEDSPQCWSGRNNEHYKDISGENIVGIGQWKGGAVLSWCIADQYDFGIEKL